MFNVMRKTVHVLAKSPLYLIGLMAIMLIDTSLSTSLCISLCLYTVTSSIPIFLILATVFFIIQIMLIRNVFGRTSGKSFKSSILMSRYLTSNVVILFQVVLAALIGVILLQIVYYDYYSTSALVIITILSYSCASLMLGLLALRFFSWFRSNKNLVVLLYACASATLTINAMFTLLFVTLSLEDRPPEVRQYTNLSVQFSVDPLTLFLGNASTASYILSFILMWCAAASMMAHYARKMGRAKYWILVGIPLIFYASQFLLPVISIYPTLLEIGTISTTLLFTLIFTFSKPVGGILFGLAFWSISKTLRQNKDVRNYMMISAYGLILVFASNQATLLINSPYPPFGVITSSIMGLSSYFVLVGIYSSAISLSQDSKLRQSIRKFATEETKLLDSIGMAHMEQEIQRRVIAFTRINKDRMVEESGIQTSLTDEDMKHYLEQVIREVKIQKTTTGKTNNGSE